MSGSTIQNNQLQQWKDDAIASPGFSEFVQETLALTKRLFIQLQRRPSTLAAGIVQPLMWLILFGALFQNVPQGLFGDSVNYGQFIGAGI
ncbi:MAG: ABC transporter permease, partial [Cyanobacteria bacterium P01_D01_bin.2]